SRVVQFLVQFLSKEGAASVAAKGIGCALVFQDNGMVTSQGRDHAANRVDGCAGRKLARRKAVCGRLAIRLGDHSEDVNRLHRMSHRGAATLRHTDYIYPCVRFLLEPLRVLVGFSKYACRQRNEMLTHLLAPCTWYSGAHDKMRRFSRINGSPANDPLIRLV